MSRNVQENLAGIVTDLSGKHSGYVWENSMNGRRNVQDSSGKILGAVVSSRTGIMYTEEPKLSGWKCKMTEGRSGHWLFPLVNVALDFARIQY